MSMIRSETSRLQRTLARNRLAVACMGALLLAASGSVYAADGTQAASQNAGPQAQVPTKAQSKASKKKKKQAAQNLAAVTVTGIRGSIANSLAIKQNASDLVEVISAEDIGKLPDASIAESLSRLPGLATQRGTDGHANEISIRGLAPNFTGTTINGREEATTGENRGVQFDQFPAELINGVTVYKTPDASLVGQGLAGTVDLHTIKPLDYNGMKMVANVRGERTSNGKLMDGVGVSDTGHRASFSFIDQFLDHTLGVAVGVAQLDSPSQQKQYQSWWWSVDNGPAGVDQNWGGPHTPGLPDNVISQEGMQLRVRSTDQVRDGLMSVIQWAPNDWYYSSLDLFYSKFDRRAHQTGLQWSSSPYDGVTYDNPGTTAASPYPIVTSGTVNNIAPIMQNEYTREKDHLFSAGWNNEFHINDNWTVTTDLSYSSARVALHDAYAFTGLPDGQLMSVGFGVPSGYDYPNFNPSVDLSDPAQVVFTDPDKYGYNGRAEFDHQKDEIKAFRLNVNRQLGGIFDSVDFGFNYSDRTKTKRADVFFAWLNGNGSTADTYDPRYSVPVESSALLPATSLGYGGIGNILNYDVLQAMSDQFYLTARNGQNDYNRNYSVEEKVPLGYVKFNIDTMLGDMPLTGNAGVQMIHTIQSSKALQTNGDSLAGSLYGRYAYNNVLPSLNLKLAMPYQQFLRFGLAKELARGRIDDEKIASSAGVYEVQDGPAAGQVLWSGSGGNIRLKPYVAVGADLQYSKYFGKASYVAMDVFKKNLLNYIYTNTVVNYDFSGYTNDNPTLTPSSTTGSYTTPQNGTGGMMEGLELSGAIEGDKISPVLSGFGAQANFSLTNSAIPQSTIASIPGAPSSLPGLSRKVANLALYYEAHGWQIRVAERYRSSFTGEAVALFDQLGYTKVLANKETDFQASYDFSGARTKGLSVVLQISNLTNEPYKTEQISGLPDGEKVGLPLEYDTWGRTVLLGVNYKL
ncbi:TonB-dependent receptor [Oleiagrimonas sp. C23AA]|uniref:TonB-dependent receptor n=1 Tax=Oleiagrimonas sp. C23AA TaxID=2719047 RepID=UPI0014234D2D|nr:TonB-dependent receptor [Oleiagrimonas sp. C23AA]NII11396.1 TonB-dependent receptor [Oleiagrimonas sp. C23AA]